MLDRQTRPDAVNETGTAFYCIPMPENASRLLSLDIELDSIPFALLAKFETATELMHGIQNSYSIYRFTFPSNMPIDKATSIRGEIKCRTP